MWIVRLALLRPYTFVVMALHIALLGARTDVRVRWHPFQLDPDLPKAGLPRREYWRAKFGSEARIAEIVARVTDAARGEGLAFDLDRITRQPNTLAAHRVLWLAEQLGVQDAVVEALFRGFFRDGRDIGDRATLVELAAGAGLDRARVERMLAGDLPRRLRGGRLPRRVRGRVRGPTGRTADLLKTRA